MNGVARQRGGMGMNGVIGRRPSIAAAAQGRVGSSGGGEADAKNAGALRCNRCWKELNQSAFVTSCEHVFCEKCVQLFEREPDCPFCNLRVDREAQVLEIEVRPLRILDASTVGMLALAGIPADELHILHSRAAKFQLRQAQLQCGFLIEQNLEKEKYIGKMKRKLASETEQLHQTVETQEKRRAELERNLRAKDDAYQSLQKDFDDKARQIKQYESMFDKIKRKNAGAGAEKENNGTPPLTPFSSSDIADRSQTQDMLLDRSQLFGACPKKTSTFQHELTQPVPIKQFQSQFRRPLQSQLHVTSPASTIRSPLFPPRTSAHALTPGQPGGCLHRGVTAGTSNLANLTPLGGNLRSQQRSSPAGVNRRRMYSAPLSTNKTPLGGRPSNYAISRPKVAPHAQSRTPTSMYPISRSTSYAIGKMRQIR